MIRVLHTADWHIGQTLRGYSRESEHRSVFARLASIVAEREIDALIVAGDVFDSPNPSGEAQQLFYETLVRLAQARPAMTSVIVAGNHDAAGRLEAPRALLEAFRVRVVGSVRRSSGRIEAGRHLVPLPDHRGEIAAHVLAVSHPTAACLPPFARFEDAAGSPIVRAVRSLYAELMEATEPRLGGLPLIATGHLHVAGGLESEGAERRILVGGEHAVPHDVFPAEVAYVALGHLHRAQEVGRPTVRYCGSLIPLSSTEQGYRHGVTLVTLDGAAVTSEHIPIERPVPFLRLPATGAMRLDELDGHLAALGLPADLPLEQRPFVQIHLSREGIGSGAREEADRIAEAFPVRVVDLRIAPVPGSPGMLETGPLPRLIDRDPAEMFRLAFERQFGHPPEPAHLAVFHRARAEA